MPIPESDLIRRIRRQAQFASSEVRLGIGDDCAVLRPKAGEDVVVTTDLSVEATHFRLDWHTPESVGHRCLARGLSDIAAMGARPMACFLSLGLPAKTKQSWVDGFFRGLIKLTQRYDCPLAGGDTGESKSSIVADITVIGAVRRGKALLRSGAKPGDTIYVTGQLGAAAAGLKQLASSRRRGNSRRDQHSYPEPRIAIGSYVREKKLGRATIDISDGLSIDLGHICEESGVGAVLNRELIPVAPNATLEMALHGGEDYELLFTAPANAKVPVEISGVPITEVGWITRERGLYITDLRSKPQRLLPKGWQYFSR
jgi:thiamine-monophosphate kinase